MLRFNAKNASAIKRNGVPLKENRCAPNSLRPPLQEQNVRFECPRGDCKQTFTQKQGMERHVRTVHGGERYSCTFDNCERSFSQKGNMLKHLRAVHLGARDFACSFDGCQQVFSRKHYMLRHVRTVHLAARDFLCTFGGCDKAFSEKKSLDRHVRTVHLAARDFACTFEACKQAFSTRQSMLQHVRAVHEGIRDVPCTYDGCHQVFSQKQEMLRHYACWHTKEGMQRKVKKQDRLRMLLEEKYAVDSECTIRYQAGCVPDPDRFCSRLDFHVVGIPDVTVIVENDEEGHRSYGLTCELSRMEQIHEAIMKAHEQDSAGLTPCKPVLFVRFNCDPYTVDGVKRKTRQEDRDTKLLEFLESVFEGRRRYTEPINVVYVCYDSTDGKADVVSDPEYYPQMKACVRECITE